MDGAQEYAFNAMSHVPDDAALKTWMTQGGAGLRQGLAQSGNGAPPPALLTTVYGLPVR